MNNTDKEYFRLLNLILNNGRVKKNRTGVDTIGVFGAQARFDLQEGFPLLTTKKVFFKAIVHELLWFISGSTNIKYLVDNDVHIWDEWAYKRYIDFLNTHPEQTKRHNPHGDLGGNRWEHYSQIEFIKEIKENNNFALQWGGLGEGTYGGMWRKFPFHYPKSSHWAEGDINWTGIDFKFGVDQLQKVVNKLKTNPDDRRLIVSAWHPYHVDHCVLPPCHCLFHFNTEELTWDERIQLLRKVHGDYHVYDANENDMKRYNIPTRRLNCLLYQRSCDTFLGVPFNIASYSLLLAMVAQVSDMVAGEFVHTYGDLHLYNNHLEQVKLQLSREPKALPKLVLNPDVKDLFKFKFEDIKLEGYDPHPAIKGEVAV